MKPQRLARTIIYENPWVNLYLDKVRFPDGRIIEKHHLLDFEKEAGGSPFPLPATHQELALRLGTVREVVSRNLSRFQAQGLIQIQNREVSILDRQGLETEAETEMQ